jgi:hypothetical protein
MCPLSYPAFHADGLILRSGPKARVSKDGGTSELASILRDARYARLLKDEAE